MDNTYRHGQNIPTNGIKWFHMVCGGGGSGCGGGGGDDGNNDNYDGDCDDDDADKDDDDDEDYDDYDYEDDGIKDGYGGDSHDVEGMVMMIMNTSWG